MYSKYVSITGEYFCSRSIGAVWRIGKCTAQGSSKLHCREHCLLPCCWGELCPMNAFSWVEWTTTLGISLSRNGNLWFTGCWKNCKTLVGGRGPLYCCLARKCYLPGQAVTPASVSVTTPSTLTLDISSNPRTLHLSNQIKSSGNKMSEKFFGSPAIRRLCL